MKIDVVTGRGSEVVELPERFAGRSWMGPRAMGREELRERIEAVLESPTGGLPPLRQVIVPGDRVAIAVDPSTPSCGLLLNALIERLGAGGIEPAGITIVADRSTEWEALRSELTDGVILKGHDPEDRGELAYLAATRNGRRVYLNRALADADLVVALGRLERSPLRMLGGTWARESVIGPWNLIYPTLSDGPTRVAAADLAESEQDERGRTPSHVGGLRESLEVSGLLGLVFQMGVIPARGDGVHELRAGTLGEDGTLRRAILDAWRYEPGAAADLVVARIGAGGVRTTWPMLVAGILSALRVVREGGTLLVFASGEEGDEPGKAIARLSAGDEVRQLRAIRGMDDASDYVLARALTGIAPAWHIGLCVAGLDRDLLEGLGFLPIEGVATAQRLIAAAECCVFIERPELTGIRTSEAT